ncbi:unnamed protein product [Leptosia nina]|uniref:Uncharacterized protein n=1 Tax=Leptosia nina TaxID=320188 RepID=A0AAV1JI87_9NEOP
MVVLEGGGALLEPALALDGAAAACLERAYAQADVSLKLLPKRYINLHQWLSPVTTSVTAASAAGKDLKLQILQHNDSIGLKREILMLTAATVVGPGVITLRCVNQPRADALTGATHRGARGGSRIAYDLFRNPLRLFASDMCHC